MAGGGVLLVKRTTVDNPPAGKVRIFVDASGHLSAKDETGAVVTPQTLIASLEALVATKQDSATAATDTELTAAVATLTTAISAKQDSSSAATDAELASAVSTLNAAIALKQDATTAATDAELASEKSAREAADTAEAVAREFADNDLAEDLATKQASATAATDAELAAGLAGKQSTAEKGQANGYPSLDGSGHVPSAQMPVGALTYKGAWDAATNTPTLSDATGAVGEQYAITVAGTRNLGSGAVDFKVGGVLLHNGTVWQQIASPNDVASVFGRKGAVAAQGGDYAIGQISGAGSAAGKDAGAAGTAGKVLNADDPVLPSPGQKNALSGLHGTPGSGNEFATKQSIGAAGSTGKALAADDPTTTDNRAPKAHAASHGAEGGDPLTLAPSQVSGLGNGALATIGVDVPGFTDARLEAMKTLGLAQVIYGEDASKARPTNVFHVVWVGKLGVVPVNAQRYDLIIADPAWE